jgi:hypothetical protein
MAGRTIDRLLETFLEAAGSAVCNTEQGGIALPAPEGAAEETAGKGAADSSASPSSTQLPSSPAANATSSAAGLYGSSENPVGSNVYAAPLSSNQTGSSGSSIGSIATTFLESGFGMAAVVQGILGLFSGGGSAQPPLQKYEMPSAIAFDSAETASGLAGADYDQSGSPRTIAPEPAGGVSASAAKSAPQITVNVQAIDAQSFLDHSDAIAQAVRGAMLNSSSINDVVNEL